MLEQLKAMEREGRWAEIRQIDPALFASLQGDDRARAYLSMSIAWERLATSRSDYGMAIHYAYMLLQFTTNCGLMRAYGQAQVAALSADLGLFEETKRYAHALLGTLRLCPQAGPLEALTRFALGRAYSYERSFKRALREFSSALSCNPKDSLAERIRLFKVWTLAEAGRVQDARRALPNGVSHVPPALLYAAQAVVSARSRQWGDAYRFAYKALTHKHATLDTIQSAELALILERAATKLDLNKESQYWRLKSATILIGWNAALIDALHPIPPEKGGERLEVAASASHRFGASDKRVGLRGAVG